MKSKGLLIALIVSLGINLGAVGTLTFNYIKKANPKLMWKDWEKKFDETWADVQDSLDITPELTAKIRSSQKAKADETMVMNKSLKENRDSLLNLMKQPQLDTSRLSELLSREEQVQTQIGYLLFTNLFDNKQLLPVEKQTKYIDFYGPAIMFTGKPWYIWTTKKEFHKDTTNKK